MDMWIETARGPLFRIALSACVLGLGYRVAVMSAQIGAAWRRAGDRRIPLAAVAVATAAWLLPFRLWRSRPLYSTASVLFHLGVTAVPVFLAGHAALLAGVLPSWWPVLPQGAADTLTVVSMIAVLVLAAGRLSAAASRSITRPQDEIILGLLLFLLLFGWWAANPELSPFAARTMLLLHIVVGDVVLVLVPTTRIAHCALYPLARLVFQLGWHFPAESGRHVARALSKEGEAL